MTFVGGSEEVECDSSFFICSLEFGSEWRLMPFFPFVTVGVLLLMICKPFEVTAVRSGCAVVIVVPPIPIPFVDGC